MTDTFLDLNIGDSAKVLGLQGLTTSYRKKLMSLGLTPGTQFKLERKAPLGDPIEISVRGFRLSLRKAEAGSMTVEKL